MKKFKVLNRMDANDYIMEQIEGGYKRGRDVEFVKVVNTNLYIDKEDSGKKYKNIVKAFEAKGISFEDYGKSMVAVDDYGDLVEFYFEVLFDLESGEVMSSKIDDVMVDGFNKPLSYFLKGKDFTDFMKNVEWFSGDFDDISYNDRWEPNYHVSFQDSYFYLD